MIGAILGGYKSSGANPMELSDITGLECPQG
jgi:hypothetical protein